VEFCADFPANSWDIIRGLSPYDWDDLLGAGMNAPARALRALLIIRIVLTASGFTSDILGEYI
jgi:hypothetical protein